MINSIKNTNIIESCYVNFCFDNLYLSENDVTFDYNKGLRILKTNEIAETILSYINNDFALTKNNFNIGELYFNQLEEHMQRRILETEIKVITFYYMNTENLKFINNVIN